MVIIGLIFNTKYGRLKSSFEGFKYMYNDTNRQDCLSMFFKTILFLLAFIVFLLVVLTVFCPFAANILADRVFFIQNDLNQKELMQLTDLIKTKKLFTGEVVFGRIVSFYETLITYLLGLFSVSGILGYIWIRKTSKTEMRDEICNQMMSSFFKEITEMHVKKTFSEEKNLGGELYEIIDRLENVEKRMEFLENSINNAGDTLQLEDTE